MPSKRRCARDRDPERALQAGHRGTASPETRAGPTRLRCRCEAAGRGRLASQTLQGRDAESSRREAVLGQETGGSPGTQREPQEGSLTGPSHPDSLRFNKCV